MTGRSASHVFLIEPVDLRSNAETMESNAFQQTISEAETASLAALAREQHRTLRDLLVENGVAVTVARSLSETPDATFCNNWFSTHPAVRGGPGRMIVLYPMLAENRRRERRPDLIELLSHGYDTILDLSEREKRNRYLESTGSLCLDDGARVAYAALSPRTDRELAQEWANTMGYRLEVFRAVDEAGVPYYHTNVMMFIGHGLAGVCLECIADPSERSRVERSLQASGNEILPITRQQVRAYCGNCLPLTSDTGERLLVMSSTAFQGFEPSDRSLLQRHARILHTPLDAFETLGGGSARCLLGELF